MGSAALMAGTTYLWLIQDIQEKCFLAKQLSDNEVTALGATRGGTSPAYTILLMYELVLTIAWYSRRGGPVSSVSVVRPWDAHRSCLRLMGKVLCVIGWQSTQLNLSARRQSMYRYPFSDAQTTHQPGKLLGLYEYLCLRSSSKT